MSSQVVSVVSLQYLLLLAGPNDAINMSLGLSVSAYNSQLLVSNASKIGVNAVSQHLSPTESYSEITLTPWS